MLTKKQTKTKSQTTLFMWCLTNYLSLQVIDPQSNKFKVLKTKGRGTENGYIDITTEVAMKGTYTDSTEKLVIVQDKDDSNRILVIFSSGLSFELRYGQIWSDALNVKIPQEYAAENQSCGIMGSTPTENFANCELIIH